MKNFSQLLKNSTLSANPKSQDHVLGLYSDAFGVDSAKIGISKQTNEISFGSFLKSRKSSRLTSKPSFETPGDFTDEPLERQFADDKLCTFFIPANFTEFYRTRTKAIRL
ncbi:Protein of unknown function [Cotesia congregata]|uniref:Uncharacterized protein n=1 Tax=Cotesia congregata TaxID=51543 RepID=A0A8J2MXS6_COTCN|nr:Protein of unknown function [Cotesia congregata]